jgi:cytochrome b involved in lipid metabolism
MEEVNQHNSENSLWVVFNGEVYDLTMYYEYHPGGANKLIAVAGKDCTSFFSKL